MVGGGGGGEVKVNVHCAAEINEKGECNTKIASKRGKTPENALFGSIKLHQRSLTALQAYIFGFFFQGCILQSESAGAEQIAQRVPHQQQDNLRSNRSQRGLQTSIEGRLRMVFVDYIINRGVDPVLFILNQTL